MSETGVGSGAQVASMGRRGLVVGSYPPVPGEASAATLAAVRRCWERDIAPVVASPRPSAADVVVPYPGKSAAQRVVEIARLHGCTTLVACFQPGWPFLTYDRQPQVGPWYPDLRGRAVRAWAHAFAQFEHVELVVTGEIGLAPSLFACLWPGTHTVVASSDATAGRLRAMGAPNVEVVVPAPLSTRASEVGVGPMEPEALLLAVRARRLAGSLARRYLGEHAPAVRARLARFVRL